MPRACSAARRSQGALRGAPLLVWAAAACGSTPPAPAATAAAPAAAPPAEPASPEDDFLIVPGRRVGPIDGSIAREQLAALLPGQILAEDNCGGGDGDDIPCTRVAAAEGAEALIVYWRAAAPDADAGAAAARDARFIDVVSDRFHTQEGVRIGLTLPELVAKNGGTEIQFYGFGWDFGGTVSNLGGGPLDQPGLEIRLAYAVGTDPALIAPLTGEGEFKSSDPRTAKVAIRVDRLRVRLARGSASSP